MAGPGFNQAETTSPYSLNDFAIHDLRPKAQTLSRFKRWASVEVSLVNRSEQPARFHVAGMEPSGRCHVEFMLPQAEASLARQIELRLEPGETVAFPLRLVLPENHLCGITRPTYRFILTATMVTGRPASRSVLGQVSRSPLLGPWLMAPILVSGLVLLIFGAWFLWTRPPAGAPVEQILVENDQTRAEAADIAALIARVQAELAAQGQAPSPRLKAELTYEEIFREIGPRYDLDWRLLAEVAYQESRMDPLAVGGSSELGLMQILPSTWLEWAPKVGVSDPFDPYSNVLVGAAYLAYVRDYCRSRGYEDDYWMLIGYNWGPDNVRRVFEAPEDQAQVPERRHNYAMAILKAYAIAADRWRSAAEAFPPAQN